MNLVQKQSTFIFTSYLSRFLGRLHSNKKTRHRYLDCVELEVSLYNLFAHFVPLFLKNEISSIWIFYIFITNGWIDWTMSTFGSICKISKHNFSLTVINSLSHIKKYSNKPKWWHWKTFFRISHFAKNISILLITVQSLRSKINQMLIISDFYEAKCYLDRNGRKKNHFISQITS